jgi:hypothetical protein
MERRRGELAVLVRQGDETTGVTELMSAGAGDTEEISFGVGEVAEDEAAR